MTSSSLATVSSSSKSLSLVHRAFSTTRNFAMGRSRSFCTGIRMREACIEYRWWSPSRPLYSTTYTHGDDSSCISQHHITVTSHPAINCGVTNHPCKHTQAHARTCTNTCTLCGLCACVRACMSACVCPVHVCLQSLPSFLRTVNLTSILHCSGVRVLPFSHTVWSLVRVTTPAARQQKRKSLLLLFKLSPANNQCTEDRTKYHDEKGETSYQFCCKPLLPL